MAGGTTLPQRAMGRLLRELRTGAGKSLMASGQSIDVSPQTVGRMEAGHPVRVSRSQLRDLIQFYGGSEAAETDVMALYIEAREAKGDTRGGWWRAYADLLASHFNHYLSLEDAARQLTTFRLALLPGLLQTGEYRRAVIAITGQETSAVDVEREIEWAARRADQLQDGTRGLHFTAYLYEPVLRSPLGGRGVMAGQLRHLVMLSELPFVTIRAVPIEAGGHVGLVTQSFTMFDFPKLQSTREPEPPVVYVEGYAGALYLEDELSISRHRHAIEDIERVALSSAATRDLVLKIAEEYES